MAEQFMADQDGPQLYTVDEVAKRLRVGRTTVFFLLKTGLSSLRVGRSRRIRSDALSSFIAERESLPHGKQT
jgi:excisionase family DNA binding protein